VKKKGYHADDTGESLRRQGRDLVRRNLYLPLVGAAVAVLTLAGCGGSSDALHAVTSATATTLSQPLVSNLTLHDVKLLGAVRPTVIGRGIFAFDTGTGYERIVLPGETQQGVAPSEYLDLLPTKLYFQRATAARGVVLYKRKAWVAPAIVGPASADSIVPRFVLQVQALSPQLLLDELSWGAVSATQIATPVVNHLPLAEYRVRVNLKQALSKATGVTRAALTDELAANGSTTVSILVWVDGPGYVAELQASVPGSGLGTVTMALSSFGLKFRASLPTDAMLLHIDARTPSGADLLRSAWIF
jgi:hypothetical protein